MAPRKTDYTGDRFGDWFVESKAPAVDSKRMWNVVNTVTDQKLVVPQTELKNLVGRYSSSRTKSDHVHHGPTAEGCCADVQANSAQITERVLIGNGKLDAFSAGDGPDDDSEYPFTVEFAEPDDIFATDDEDCCDDYTCGLCREDDANLCVADELIGPECGNCLSACPADENCTIVEGKHFIDAVAAKDMPAPTREWTEEAVGGKYVIDTSDPKHPTSISESPWDTELRVAIRECMMHMSDARNALDRVLKLVVNQ